MVESFLVFNEPASYLLIAFLVIFIALQVYYALIMSRPLQKLNKAKPIAIQSNYPPVSVIIYAKDESTNLQHSLSLILAQDYPLFEVIVINDGSTDESNDLLKSLECKHKNLYHTFVPDGVKYLSRKKLALTIGVKAAKYDILLFTDANCYPQSKLWIKQMAQNFTPETDIVLGYCANTKSQKFFQKLTSFDNLKFGFHYLSAAILKHPYMGCGRNLAYRKALFFKQKGFSKTLNLQAGEDDLFINSIANKQNTKVELSPLSIMAMHSFDYFSLWKEMKASRNSTMHLLKGAAINYYKLGNILEAFFFLSFIAIFIMGLLGNKLLIAIGILLYLIKQTTHLLILRKWGKILNETDCFQWILLFMYILPIYNGYIYLYRIFKGSKDYTFRIDNR